MPQIFSLHQHYHHLFIFLVVIGGGRVVVGWWCVSPWGNPCLRLVRPLIPVERKSGLMERQLSDLCLVLALYNTSMQEVKRKLWIWVRGIPSKLSHISRHRGQDLTPHFRLAINMLPYASLSLSAFLNKRKREMDRGRGWQSVCPSVCLPACLSICQWGKSVCLSACMFETSCFIPLQGA